MSNKLLRSGDEGAAWVHWGRALTTEELASISGAMYPLLERRGNLVDLVSHMDRLAHCPFPELATVAQLRPDAWHAPLTPEQAEWLDGDKG